MAEADARRLAILEAIRDDKMVRVSDLSRRFGVSEVTIRRDLGKLDEYGLLTRVHGGAIVAAPETGDHSYAERTQLQLEEKGRIGRAAADLIKGGDRIILDSGTTVLQVAQELAVDPPPGEQVTVITASLPVLRALAQARHVHVIVLGGIFLPEHQVLVGPQTLANLQNLHADKLFLGADGLGVESGLTSAAVLEAEVSRAMVRAAEEVIVVTDSSKINNVGFTPIMPLSKMNRLITDQQAPDDFISALREMGVQVTLV